MNYLDLFVFLNVKELEQNKIFTLRAGFLGIPLPLPLHLTLGYTPWGRVEPGVGYMGNESTEKSSSDIDEINNKRNVHEVSER